MYIMDVSETVADAQTEGDADMELYGDTFVKADVVAALVDLGINVDVSMTDAQILEEINKLSEEDEAIFKDAIGA